MNFRDKLQDKWASEIYSSNRAGRAIAHLCPRAGKIRTSIRFFENIKHQWKTNMLKVLIAYPDKNIQKSWEDDFKVMGYDTEDVDYVTHISLHKVDKSYDVIIIDEIHLLSAKQKAEVKRLIKANQGSYQIGLSGTLSKQTEQELDDELDMPVVVKYDLEQAIKDGIISDYRINIITTDLDDKVIVDKTKKRTEKAKYRAISWVIENKGSNNLFLNLSRMRLIHNSIAKTETTKRILSMLKDERVLVFCANNKVAKALGCKVHTAKFSNQDEFEKFIGDTSKHNHLAVCKIGNTGVSFKSLDHIVINAFDSNSENLTQRICRSLILDAKGKVSNIYIVSSTEKAELKWLEKSLEFFDKKKIKYL